jgi:hypothetical protein
VCVGCSRTRTYMYARTAAVVQLSVAFPGRRPPPILTQAPHERTNAQEGGAPDKQSQAQSLCPRLGLRRGAFDIGVAAGGLGGNRRGKASTDEQDGVCGKYSGVGAVGEPSSASEHLQQHRYHTDSTLSHKLSRSPILYIPPPPPFPSRAIWRGASRRRASRRCSRRSRRLSRWRCRRTLTQAAPKDGRKYGLVGRDRRSSAPGSGSRHRDRC